MEVYKHVNGDHMNLIIQIPCYNEAKTLAGTIADLPKEVEGFESVEVLVIDDGSDDETADVARKSGADHVVSIFQNSGLANAFAVGLEKALRLGADVIVNTDADNQYKGECITDLVKPILEGDADIVIGDRQTHSIAHFSAAKKLLQKFGSWVVRWTSGTGVPDATSGFRALSRDAALQIVVFSTYTFTLETVIQAGKRGLNVVSIPIETNPMQRESRLIRSIPRYIILSAITIFRIFVMYEALRVFVTIGSVMFGLGLILSFRFVFFFMLGEGNGHIQSLILASILLVFGFQAFLLGILGDLISKNRRLSEETLYRLKKQQLDQ